MINQILKEIGLTDYEAKVYLALLHLGKATSGEILKKAGIYSGKIYEILDSLQRKGFVSIIIENKVKKFSPSDPRRIRDYLEEKKNDLIKQEKDYDKILPELLNKFGKIKEDAKIEIYTGFRGFKTALMKETEDAKKGDELYIMGVVNFEKYGREVIDFFINKIYPRRESLKLKTKKIYDPSAKKNIDENEKNSQIKYLPYSSLASFNIISNLTIIGIYYGEMIFIVIESEEVAKGFKEQFNLLWKIAKP